MSRRLNGSRRAVHVEPLEVRVFLSVGAPDAARESAMPVAGLQALVVAAAPGITSSDVTPPQVTSSQFVETPRQEIRINFTEDVGDSVDLDDLQVVNDTTGQRVSPGDFFLNVRSGPSFPTEATWVPSAPLPAGQYTATLPAGSVADANGNLLAEDYSFQFRSTAAPVGPSVTSAVYSTYANGMGKEVELNFSEAVLESDIRAATPVVTNRATGEVMRGIELKGWGGDVTGVLRAQWGGQSILPTGNYRFTLPAGSVHDPDGNPMAADFTYDFSVGAQPDNVRPTLVRASYVDWPAPEQRLRFEFSEDISFGVDADAIQLTNLDTGQTLPASALGGGGGFGTAAEWAATQSLPAARYRAVVPAGAVRDLYGNSLASDATLEFQVTGPGDRTPPTVVGTRLRGDIAALLADRPDILGERAWFDRRRRPRRHGTSRPTRCCPPTGSRPGQVEARASRRRRGVLVRRPAVALRPLPRDSPRRQRRRPVGEHSRRRLYV